MKIEMTKRKINIDQFALAICYKIVLDISYVLFEAPYFGYVGFQCEPNILKTVISWAIYMAVFCIIKSDKRELSVLFTYMIFALSMAPFMTLYQFLPACKLWMVILQMVAVIYIHILATKCKIEGAVLKAVPYDSPFVMGGFTTYIIVFGLYALYKFGIPAFALLGFENISQIRAAAQLSTLDSIIINVSCRVIVPLYILLLFYEKKFAGCFLGIIVQLYIYSVTGFKTFLFIPLVMIALIIFEKWDLKKLFFLGLTGAFVAVDLFTVVIGNLMPYALIGDRTVFFPALIKWAYLDYFSKNEYIYFSQNTISKLLGITSNYSVNVPNLIGEKYFNKMEMWTNTGFIPDAYSNLGILGVFITATLMALILLIVSKRVDQCQGKMKKALETIYILYFVMFNLSDATYHPLICI